MVNSLFRVIESANTENLPREGNQRKAIFIAFAPQLFLENFCCTAQLRPIAWGMIQPSRATSSAITVPYQPPTPQTQQPEEDATADFAQTLADPNRWVVKRSVPLFKQHQRKDPNTGNMIRVDLPKLYRIASNMQRLERDGGVPIRMTLGHTEPGKPETQQPPVGGYYRNPRVQPFGPKGEPAVVADEWLDPQYSNVRKNYPYRSAEYYDDSEQITGVALLTRDPFLDLGVVAYAQGDRAPIFYNRPADAAVGRVVAQEARASGFLSYSVDAPVPPAPVHYDRRTGTVRRPVMYHFVSGDEPMPVPVPPQQTAGVQPPAPFAAVPPQYNPQPGVPRAPQRPAPTPYAGGYPQTQYRPWPGPAHQRANIGHQHPSGGAVYGASRYATEPPPGMEEGPPDPGGGGGGDVLEQVYDCLQQALQALQGALAGGSGSAPQSPMGPSGGPPGGPTMSSRYGAQGQRRPAYSSQRQPRRYNRAEQVQGQPGVERTISGLPVGYQLKVDNLESQLTQANQALQVLYYERDQADTGWCVAEIRRLAGAGYAVGEYEIGELKKKAPEEREHYLNHIATRYQKVGTEILPPLLGDPTPGPAPDHNRPATREEMDAALSMTQGNDSPRAFTEALQYIRAGGQPAFYGQNRFAPQQQQNPAEQYGWAEGAPAPGYEANGDGY